VKPVRLALLWLALVLLLGSAYFGPQQTQQHVVPLLRKLAPWLPPSTLQAAHAALRKLAHVIEYAVLALLWLRAFQYRGRLGGQKATWAALAMCLACAIADEVHQARVPGRHGGVEDVVLDSLGAIAALMVVRSRRNAVEASLSSTTPTGGGETVRFDERA
jgi:VanZ family protein